MLAKGQQSSGYNQVMSSAVNRGRPRMLPYKYGINRHAVHTDVTVKFAHIAPSPAELTFSDSTSQSQINRCSIL